MRSSTVVNHLAPRHLRRGNIAPTREGQAGRAGCVWLFEGAFVHDRHESDGESSARHHGRVRADTLRATHAGTTARRDASTCCKLVRLAILLAGHDDKHTTEIPAWATELSSSLPANSRTPTELAGRLGRVGALGRGGDPRATSASFAQPPFLATRLTKCGRLLHLSHG